MTRGSDQVALAGAAVAGIISIGSAEGRYEPFDATMGIVLAILLACFYRPPRPATWMVALRQSAGAASVFALVLCIMIAPLLDAAAESLTAPLTERRAAELTVQISWQLFSTWVVAFLTLWMIAFGWASRPRAGISAGQVGAGIAFTHDGE